MRSGSFKVTRACIIPKAKLLYSRGGIESNLQRGTPRVQVPAVREIFFHGGIDVSILRVRALLPVREETLCFDVIEVVPGMSTLRRLCGLHLIYNRWTSLYVTATFGLYHLASMVRRGK